MKELDQKINEKIKTLKKEFLENRSKSLSSNNDKPYVIVEETKKRLIDHLNKKPSSTKCH